MSEESLRDPYFDLEPKRTRPLSLWNPLDYLTLLWWVFYFPQALPWYVGKFVREDFRAGQTWAERSTLLRSDPVLRQLCLQALFLVVGLPVGGYLVAWEAGLQIMWPTLFLGVAVGLAFGVAFGVAEGVARGVVFGIVFGIAFGVAFGVDLDAELDVAGGVAVLVAVLVPLGGAVGVAVGVAFGVAEGVAVSVAVSVAFGVAGGVAFGVAFGVAIGVAGGIAGGIAGGVAEGVVFGVAISVASTIFLTRALDWLLGVPIVASTFPGWCRLTPLPLPSVRSRLRNQFDKNWESGLWANNQLFQYTLQFSPAIAAQNEALASSSSANLLPRAALLAEGIVDPQALRFGSASLRAALKQKAAKGVLFLGEGWSAKFPVDLRFDTPAQCACAGFWLLHDWEPAQAAEAFARLCDLPFGTELEEICRALANTESVLRADHLSNWRQSTEGLEAFAEPLRKATLNALKELREVAAEVEAALNAQARVNRSAALGRATATLQRLAQDSNLPKPEGEILRSIAQQWLPMVIELGGEAGEAVLREPVKNPYVGYSGLPIEGPTFVGRADVLRQLERLWTGDDQNWAAIFLYGHRRMGKTSVLRNLQKALRPGTVVVQLDMQGAAYVDHTGQLLFEFAKAIHKRCTEMNLDAGEKPRPEEFASLGDGRLRLEALIDQIEPQFQQQTLVLAIDEFEVVEERIEQGKVDPDFLTYLRSLNQRHRFLAIIFAGLHTLEEMGRHYGNAFFGQAEHVRVDYLKKADAMRLITQPSEDFSLEYSPALREELYRRTHGQPYLLQRLCWELVENFNERFLELGPKAPRTLELADLDALDADEFFLATHYYFQGVWSHRTEPEQQLLRRLAAAPGPLSRTDLGDEDQKAIERLLRHDVVLVENDQIDFAAILLREWVARHHPLPD